MTADDVRKRASAMAHRLAAAGTAGPDTLAAASAVLLDCVEALAKGQSSYPLPARSALRQRFWDPDGKLGLLFLSNEMGGECGEAQNAVKKLERERLGLVGSRITTRAVGHELADVVICASNVAWKIGVDLFGESIPEKFDITSEKYGLPVRWLP